MNSNTEQKITAARTWPVVLSIAGSDCSGGAGIQADLKTISSLGVYAATAITAITIQNTTGVKQSIPLPPTTVAAQIEAVLTDLNVKVIKIGMVCNKEIIQAIVSQLEAHPSIPVIVDPIIVSSSGRTLLEPDAIESLKQLLLPKTWLITPNLPEAELLTGVHISHENDLNLAAQAFTHYGCIYTLIKGGHRSSKEMTDVLFGTPSSNNVTQRLISFNRTKVESVNTHGTGCTLSSAIAAHIALGYNIKEAIEKSKNYITDAISHSKDVKLGHSTGPLNHFFNPKKMKIE